MGLVKKVNLNRTIDSLYVDQTKDDLELTNEELISRIFFALDEPLAGVFNWH